MNKCPLTEDAEIGTEETNIPCELCAVILELRKVITEAGREIKQLKPVITFNRMQKEFRKILNAHTHCGRCGLYFGGDHVAFSTKSYKGFGNVCQWCEDEIEKEIIRNKK